MVAVVAEDKVAYFVQKQGFLFGIMGLIQLFVNRKYLGVIGFFKYVGSTRIGKDTVPANKGFQ